MKHIKGFNENINWNKLNIFSSKKKEEINEDDEALAKAIYSLLKYKVKGDEVTGDAYSKSGLTFEYDGDRFQVYANGIFVNDQKLDCSKKTATEFYKLFSSKKEEYEKDKNDLNKKEVKDRLKAKYRPAPNFYAHGQ